MKQNNVLEKKKEFLENIIRSEKAQIKLNHSKFKVTKFNEIKNNAKKKMEKIIRLRILKD
jgi:hypothetical protein